MEAVIILGLIKSVEGVQCSTFEPPVVRGNDRKARKSRAHAIKSITSPGRQLPT